MLDPQELGSEKESISGREKYFLHEERINSIAKKVACTLAECKATYADVNKIFSRVGRYLVLNTINTPD